MSGIVGCVSWKLSGKFLSGKVMIVKWKLLMSKLLMYGKNGMVFVLFGRMKRKLWILFRVLKSVLRNWKLKLLKLNVIVILSW